MKKKINWLDVDWGKQDVEIARIKGVSRERVRQVRPKGVKSISFRQRTGMTAGKRILAMETTGKSLVEIALAARCKKAYARSVVSLNGKKYRRGRGNARYDWGLVPQDWRGLTDVEIGELVGVANPAVVAQWRIRHGMRKV